MRVWFVSPAWRRFDVTRLALAQRAHLRDELAGRGISAECVVVADDDNLDIASEFGFVGLYGPNDELGRKVNDGIQFALREGADHVVLVGSDDWVHVDLFDRLPSADPEPRMPSGDEPFVMWSPDEVEGITGRSLAVVNTETGRLRRCHARNKNGAIPWVLPARAFQKCGGRPVPEGQQVGIDGALVVGLGHRPRWVFTDPHDFCRVDFKSSVNLNSYSALTAAVGVGDEEDISVLEQHYPAALVDMARSLAAVAA